jgi:hypothetical protein
MRGRSALALRERVSTLIARFSAGKAKVSTVLRERTADEARVDLMLLIRDGGDLVASGTGFLSPFRGGGFVCPFHATEADMRLEPTGNIARACACA